MMHQQLLNSFSIAFIICFLTACGSSSEFSNRATKDYSNAEMQKFSKYMIQGKSLYTTYCSNCHQAEGNGLGALYPPLAQSDYMMADKERTVCIIKNGLEGEIKVNSISYNQQMPANTKLSTLEIAEISTYIYNSWGNETGFVTVSAVDKALDHCN